LPLSTNNGGLTPETTYYTAHAVQDIPNNPVCFGSYSDGYLREKCKDISEKQAREIHPNLFKVLDSPN
jgi:hypothetical protein